MIVERLTVMLPFRTPTPILRGKKVVPNTCTSQTVWHRFGRDSMSLKLSRVLS